MEAHNWREKTEEGTRYYRAEHHAGRWRLMTQLKEQRRGEDEWETLDPAPEEVWRELRDIVWRKYQRRRCPWKLVEQIDKMLGDDTQEPGK